VHAPLVLFAAWESQRGARRQPHYLIIHDTPISCGIRHRGAAIDEDTAAPVRQDVERPTPGNPYMRRATGASHRPLWRRAARQRWGITIFDSIEDATPGTRRPGALGIVDRG
jgi:hypothetical protein